MHKFTNSIDVAARMLVVSSFLVLMPCWAAFWSHSRGGRASHAMWPRSSVVQLWLPCGQTRLCDPVGHDGIDPPTAGHSEGSRPNQDSVVPPASLPDQILVGLQGRLQQLGAGYMLLERYPDPQRGVDGSYHFVCRIPIPGNPLYQRTFEAVDGDAVAAMQHVVREVELWQTKHSPSGQTR